jgi:hypothetical protein
MASRTADRIVVHGLRASLRARHARSVGSGPVGVIGPSEPRRRASVRRNGGHRVSAHTTPPPTASQPDATR